MCITTASMPRLLSSRDSTVTKDLRVPHQSQRVVYRAACAPLRGSVLGYRAFQFHGEVPRRWFATPTGAVMMILSFDSPLTVIDSADDPRSIAATSLLGGISTSATMGVSRGPLNGISVILTPPGAYRLLKVPMTTLTNRYLDLTGFGIPELTRLVADLRGIKSWDQRFSLLDTVLASLLRGNPPGTPEVAQAWQHLRHTMGSASVNELATTAGWSRRQLERRFLEQVGVSPKSLAQVLRLEEALRLKHTKLSWADAAAGAGYHDQSHLVRAFKAMLGCVPTKCGMVPGAGDWDSPLNPLPGSNPQLLARLTGR